MTWGKYVTTKRYYNFCVRGLNQFFFTTLSKHKKFKSEYFQFSGRINFWSKKKNHILTQNINKYKKKTIGSVG